MKVLFIGLKSKDKQIFFDMLRTNLEHGYGSDYQKTIGVSICVKHIYNERQDRQQIAKLIIWDISHKKFFKWIRPLFYNGAIGGIILHSDNSSEGIQNTISILKEFQKLEFPKYLLILSKQNINDESQQNLKILEKTGDDLGFYIRFFETTRVYYQQPESYEVFEFFWKDLRKFYEKTLLDIFTDTVEKIPDNNFKIEKFRENYFNVLDRYDESLSKIYILLTQLGFEYDYRNIYVTIKEGLFSINIFSASCYYHYPDSNETKYICLIPADKKFKGWSNSFFPTKFMLSISKAVYLLEGNYDSVVSQQLSELEKRRI
ncbi:MAG: hypothetical protein ACTSWY_00875 [Promethearchaeota archaeon]